MDLLFWNFFPFIFVFFLALCWLLIELALYVRKKRKLLH